MIPTEVAYGSTITVPNFKNTTGLFEKLISNLGDATRPQPSAVGTTRAKSTPPTVTKDASACSPPVNVSPENSAISAAL